MTSDNMTILMAFNIAMGLVAALGGWLLRTLFEKIEHLEAADIKISDQLTELRVDLPHSYTSKDDFKSMGNDIFNALRRIEDKLDGKADKT